MWTQTQSALLQEHGASLDPFATPVAEREMFDELHASPFLAYYVPAHILYTMDSAEQLQVDAPGHLAIVGRAGSGKTALRYAWDVNNRISRSATLIGHYLVSGHDFGLTPAALQQHLAAELAIDLFIRIVEQYHPLLVPLTDERVSALRELIAAGPAQLRAVVAQMSDSDPGSTTELSRYWRQLGRPPVRPLPLPKVLVQILCTPHIRPAAPFKSAPLPAVVRIARLFGYERIYICVDTEWRASSQGHAPQPWLQRMAALLEACRSLPLHFRLFVPSTYHDQEQTLPPEVAELPVQVATIRWSEPQLQAVLARRMHACGIRADGLYNFADAGFAPYVDELLIKEARLSPRQLIRAASMLLNSQSAGASSRRLSFHDWHQVRETLTS